MHRVLFIAHSSLSTGKLIATTFKLFYRSPSSQSALAESELEYNDQHKSLSAFFRFRVSLFLCSLLYAFLR